MSVNCGLWPLLKPFPRTPKQKQQEPCQLLTLYQNAVVLSCERKEKKCIRNYGLMIWLLRNLFKMKGCSFSKTCTFMPRQAGRTGCPGPWGPWALHSYSSRRHLQAPQPLSAAPLFARWPFSSRPWSVQKGSMVAFCSWPQKSFASFYLPRLLLFTVWNMPERYLFTFFSSGD